eukprot:g3058.t1
MRRVQQRPRLTSGQVAIAALRRDPRRYEEDDEDEDDVEDPWRVVYVTREGKEADAIGVHVSDGRTRVKHVERVACMSFGIESADSTDDAGIVSDMCSPRAMLRINDSGKIEDLRASSAKESIGRVLAPLRRFKGVLYDDAAREGHRIIRNQASLDQFRNTGIVKSSPKFQPGVRKIIGYTPSTDPIFTGKATFDFSKVALVVCCGQTSPVEVTESKSGETIVWWRYDWTRQKSVSYAAMEIPAIARTKVVKFRQILIGPPKGHAR